ncbi:MAG: 23S rRNA (pseudouridine(1915)-N(3))-methyltransferase RlmH [Candidatus Micrarchaeia archaeon]
MPQKITLVCIGKTKEKYLADAIAEYEKRLRPFCKLQIFYLKDEGIKKEAEHLQKFIGPNTYLLDEKGKESNSHEFASFLKKQEQELTFIIGSAQGIQDNLKKNAKLISLSKMTFTHEMARVFLLEQIYRSYMINTNRNYHK